MADEPDISKTIVTGKKHHRGNLKPAHSGYRYQDIATAYMLARSVSERHKYVLVDKKQVDDDCIDDLEVCDAGGRRIRRQFKFSLNESRCLEKSDFTRAQSGLRIDRLVLTLVRANPDPADEYRLCATWQPPELDSLLMKLLEPVEVPLTIVGSYSRCYRLCGDMIWPMDDVPVWNPLEEYTKPDAEFNRTDFLTFCEKFIIELSLPIASSSLADPGPLELALSYEIKDRIGIGSYPNHDRDPKDVAALAISLATLARTQEESLTPEDIERDLGIRTDFGRVSQKFPLDKAFFHDRPIFRRTLYENALKDTRQIVTAPPGSGKSWDLTRLADELRDAGMIVARHYCYLEPGDKLVGYRITTDVFFGNLLAELVEEVPEVLGAGGARYAAGIQELEKVLFKAVAKGCRVVLIVDGLDHIARVLANTPAVSNNETDIIDQLAMLNVPEGVAVVIGSQPGPHLEPLRSQWGDALTECCLPPWLPTDLLYLMERHGVKEALNSIGVTDGAEIEQVLFSLAERAGGNPLYARYLACGMVTGLQDGTIINPLDWAVAAPSIDGDIAIYYSHLYQTASAQAQSVADLLGLIDFSVTEPDLRDMLGPIAGTWVPSALEHLAPILTSAAGQGGVRVFHESFRRFMTEELVRQNRSSTDSLSPVIEWLNARGFYRDARAYRFLLPTLHRAGRRREVLEKVSTTFVSDSVAQAHPLEAIQYNLALAVDTAASLLDWPALVRCVELHRSAYTCFEDSDVSGCNYWDTYLSLFGATALSERLLFDGQPTQSRFMGLYACSIVDDAGGAAPWREYLDLPDATGDASLDHFDEDGYLNNSEHDALVTMHGLLCVGEHIRVLRWLGRSLRDGERKPLFLRRVSARLTRMTDPQLVERIAAWSDFICHGNPWISLRTSTCLRLGIADELVRQGDHVAARDVVTLALDGADSPELAVECLAHGAPAELVCCKSEIPSTIEIAVGSDKHLRGAASIRMWVASIRLAASDRDGGSSVLDEEFRRVTGAGWYRCWLRFVIALASAESAQHTGDNCNIVDAFNELTSDLHPFTGKPRACDLYAIHRVIRETIERGLTLLQNESDWKTVLNILFRVTQETGLGFDREDGGPFPVGTLLDVLMPYSSDEVGGYLVLEFIERQMEGQNLIDTYYATHAEFSLRLARSRCMGGDRDAALVAWNQSAIYQVGYGFHKDVTIFDIIESIPALRSSPDDAALKALIDMQPLINAVVTHTDGRETNHAPNAWLRNLLEVHPAAGIELLSRTISEEHDSISWVEIQAIQDAVRCAEDHTDPELVDMLLATLSIEVRSEYDANSVIRARLEPIVQLADIDRDKAAAAIRRVMAEVSCGNKYTEAMAKQVKNMAKEFHLVCPSISEQNIKQPAPKASAAPQVGQNKEFCLPEFYEPAFPSNPSLVDLLAGLRKARRLRYREDSEVWDSTILALSYHLGSLVDEGRENDACRLLRFFARDTDVRATGREHPVGRLAAALDSAGYPHIAAMAYALAYASTSGDGGWLYLGGQSQSYLLEHAISLDANIAKQTVADEVAYALRGSWYSAGTSRHLIERISEWGDAEIAETVWREAWAVVSLRLPLAPVAGWFATLDPAQVPDWSHDEALVVLLLTRLSDPLLTRKITALEGVVRVIQKRPDILCSPLRWWLTRNTYVTSVLILFDVLWHSEGDPFQIITGIEDILISYAKGSSWSLSFLAIKLLDRVGCKTKLGCCRSSVSVEVEASLIGSKLQEVIAFVDKGDALSHVIPFWPEFPNRVIGKFDTMMKASEIQKDRGGVRYRLAFGRDGKNYPPTPVLFWHWELFQSILHDELAGLPEQLWRNGQWTDCIEDEILTEILPNTALHIGLNASRSVRPNWPLPAGMDNGESGILSIVEDDPAYAGWVRLAMKECQYVKPSELRYTSPTKEVTLYAGVVAVPLGEKIPQGVFPFKKGNIKEWWQSVEFEVFPPWSIPAGQIVGLDNESNWLGDADVLIPSSYICSQIKLIPPRYGAPMIWRDSSYEPAIVLRTWRVIDTVALDGEPVALEGQDLIIRPDITEQLPEFFHSRLRELRVVFHRELSNTDDER